MEPTNKTRHAKTKRTNLLLVLIALLLPTGVFAQKVTKVETKTESNASKMDSQQYKWKLYRYDNGTYAAYTTDGTRITPNAKIRPLYVGGGLFKLSTMQKNKYGEYIYAVYDDHGELVIPDTMSCVDIFHCGDGIYKLLRKNEGNISIWAVYDKQGDCVVPFDKGYTFVAYYPDQQSIVCQDRQGDNYTYSTDGNAYAKGFYDLSTPSGANNFAKHKTTVPYRTRPSRTQAASPQGKATVANTETDYIVEMLESDSLRWTKVKKNGFVTLFDAGNAIVVPFERGYTDIRFVKVDGHVGYFKTMKGGAYGACDIKGNEILSPRYQAVDYSAVEGFVCTQRRTGRSRIGVWMDVNGKLCQREHQNLDCDTLKGKGGSLQELAVYPAAAGWGDVHKFTKYHNDSVVWTDKISKSKGYTDIRIERDGPYYLYGDTMNFYSYHVAKGNSVGLYDFQKQKCVISTDKGYSKIGAILVPNSARKIVRFYLVQKSDHYGACDEKGREVVKPTYNTLVYDVSKGFMTKSSNGTWTPLGLFFASDGSVYKSNNGNLYQKNLEVADDLLEDEYYASAIDKYATALKYDQSAYAYYNYAVALYNHEDYRKARRASQMACRYARSENNKALENSADDLYSQSNDLIKERSRQRWETVGKVSLFALAVTADIVASAAYNSQVQGATNYGTPYYNTPYFGGTTYQYGDGGDAAIANANRIMQQTNNRMQYEMSTIQQRLMAQTAAQMAAQEAAKEAQWRQNYEQYKRNPGLMLNDDGSLLTWEQFKARCQQIEVQAWMETQQGQRNTADEPTATGTGTQQKHFQSQTSTSDCTHCYVPGNGKCNTCGGDGLMDAGFGLGVNNSPCPNCDSNHNGNCSWCHGTGKIVSTKTVYQ